MIPGIVAAQRLHSGGVVTIYPEIRATPVGSYGASTSHAVFVGLDSFSEIGDRMFILFVADDAATITPPAGWSEIANNFTVGQLRINIAWKDKTESDESAVYTTGSSVRSSYVAWSLKSGTFSSEPPSISGGSFASGNSNDLAVVTDLGAINSLVVGAIGIAGIVSVNAYPLPDSQITRLGGAGGVSAAICAINNDATSYDPGSFALASSISSIGRSILQRGASV